MVDQSPPTVNERMTREMSPDQVLGWPYVIAALERIGSWSVLALRLGTLALLQECTRAMAQKDAKPDLVRRARELVDALALMPWEG